MYYNYINILVIKCIPYTSKWTYEKIIFELVNVIKFKQNTSDKYIHAVRIPFTCVCPFHFMIFVFSVLLHKFEEASTNG